jgi:hypothetical protein
MSGLTCLHTPEHPMSVNTTSLPLVMKNGQICKESSQDDRQRDKVDDNQVDMSAMEAKTRATIVAFRLGDHRDQCINNGPKLLMK